MSKGISVKALQEREKQIAEEFEVLRQTDINLAKQEEEIVRKRDEVRAKALSLDGAYTEVLNLLKEKTEEPQTKPKKKTKK